MADNPYALRSRFSGRAPAVLRYRYRFAAANGNEAELEDLRAWWADLVAVRGVCLPERFATWRVGYGMALLTGVLGSAYLLLVVQAFPLAVVALVATGAAFVLLWLNPPALLHLDRHGIWVVRQVRTGHLPWTALCAVDACENGGTHPPRILVTFKPGVDPAAVTHRFHVQRRAANVAGKAVTGFAPTEPSEASEATWRLTVQPAGLAPRDVAMLLRWALEAQGSPHRTPQVWLDPHTSNPSVDEHEFDDAE